MSKLAAWFSQRIISLRNKTIPYGKLAAGTAPGQARQKFAGQIDARQIDARQKEAGQKQTGHPFAWKNCGIFGNCLGFTMLEMIVTVGLVSVFFGAIALVVPNTLQTYVGEKRLSKGIEMSTNIENAIAAELSAASSVSIYVGEDGNAYLSYVKNMENASGERISEQHWFPANYESSSETTGTNDKGENTAYKANSADGSASSPTENLTIKYSAQNTNKNSSAHLTSSSGNPLVFTEGSIMLEADGKPYIFNGIMDEDFYDEMSADITIYYNATDKNMSMKVRIYDEDGDICTTEKAVVLYY